MLFIKSVVFIATAAAVCDCYRGDVGVKGRSGQAIKSYGGYFPDSAGPNQAAASSDGDGDSAFSPTYHRPIVSSYQPSYGWNFNQPSRTYGGVNVLQTPHYGYNNNNNYGWANSNGWNGHRVSSSPSIPQLPSLFQSNFIPPVYYPGSFSYPNYNSFPSLFPQYNPGFGNQPVYPARNFPVGGSGGSGVTNQGGTLPTGGGAGGGGGSSSSGGGSSGGGSSGSSGGAGGGGSSSGSSGGGGGGGSSSTSGGGGSGGGSSSGGFDSFNSASNQGNGIYAYPQNPFYPPSAQQPQRPIPTQYIPAPNPERRPEPQPDQTAGGSHNQQQPPPNQYIPPQYPSRPSHPHPDQSASGSHNQHEIQRPFPTQYIPPISPERRPLPQPNQGASGQQQPVHNQYIPPQYPTRPSPPHPDQSPAESQNQHGVGLSVPSSTKSTMDLSRFPSSSLLTETRRQWTDDDEMRWQATTKAPYFENKAPGLDCTLPAAAVLGAMSALKVSSLLPLNVPSGEPILSCNATELRQAQVRINEKIYDCEGSSISVACGGGSSECHKETLECDVNIQQMDVYSVTCTNGTLISNSHIICESATLLVGKNILNCYFRDAVMRSTVNVIPLATPAPVSETFAENSLEERGQVESDESGLMPQVKGAMRNVFPHELLAMPSTVYLPQKQSMQREISEDLKTHVNGVFAVNLLASSQNDGGSIDTRLSAIDSERASRNQAQSRWQVNANIKSAPSGTKTVTSTRLGGDATQHDLHDRLVFTD